jgi:hypothetical protein
MADLLLHGVAHLCQPGGLDDIIRAAGGHCVKQKKCVKQKMRKNA